MNSHEDSHSMDKNEDGSYQQINEKEKGLRELVN